ncbi:type I polyketide synthase [Streptomyces sp. WP-1]|uniref:type I polyketide synthase n=1 Tax=Streptomyces sp. WP-1 TaxID=3041497 RepID=UPI00264A13FB|nr:beta-ketoacyl synthase N-terminal-like domain-containing protein [Streptomyces sp. WP-1]WKE69279.1 beta-ketoacyl synthase N-terminal-like domain-containing protein [Streptomyces sp. WP-1]
MERFPCAGGVPIAVVGMGCRFPGANSIGEFWDLLMANSQAVSRIPEDRFDIDDHYAGRTPAPGKTVSRDGGFLDDAFSFDAAFFGISPVEARSMDPQQRILLHVVWEALESAGIAPAGLAGSRTGVFVGQATAEYGESGRPDEGPGVRDTVGGRLRAVTAGRVSYALDLRGPSLVLDTACSSSLVAVHTARQSLLTGESGLAIAAGVNIIVSPRDSIAYSQGGMLSPDGRCRFGDASADGFVRSEGVGAVVLKPLPHALRDGDPVLALLLGSAVTNDGQGSGLLLKPAVSGQVRMLGDACRSAGIEPVQLDYVEAHGTGTPTGDTVELRALAEAAGGERPLRCGSVKTNIGHAEAAAGIAGLIKSVLIARHGVIPASLHLSDPHPLLTGERPAVSVVTENTPLAKAGPRGLLGVSSFGLSGTNAHVVVGEFIDEREPVEQTAPVSEDPHLLVLSARSAAALRRLAASYADHLGPDGAGRGQSLGDICATAATRRDAGPHRLWAVGTSHDELASVLRALETGERTPDGGFGEAGFAGPRRPVFVFSGQGSQWLGMGRGLLATNDAFRTTLRACDRAVQAELGWSVEKLLTRDADRCPGGVEIVQPALWAVQVALAAAWRDLGVEPEVCVGHSMGEVAAACVSGALSLRDAAAVICRRSRLMRRVAGGGAMLVVELSADRAREAVARVPSVCVAAENSPVCTVLAGDPAALADLSARLEADGVLCRPVDVDVASHSPQMRPLHSELATALAGLSPRDTDTELFSTVRCAPVAGPELGPDYWADNLCEPVRFHAAVRQLAASEDGLENVFLEISPHPVLTTPVIDTLMDDGAPGTAVPSLRRDTDEATELLRAAGRFFAAGGPVDWSRWYGRPVRPVPLPHYPWERTEFRRATAAARPAPSTFADRVELGPWGIAAWAEQLSVAGTTVLPPAVQIAAVLDAAARNLPGTMFAVRDVRLAPAPVPLPDPEAAVLAVALERSGDTWRAVVELEQPDGAGGIFCSSARLCPVDDSDGRRAPGELDRALARCHGYLSAAGFRQLADGYGLELDETSGAVEQLWRRRGEAVARIRPAKPAPGLWETALLPLLAAWPEARRTGERDRGFLPTGFESVQLYGELPDDFWSLAAVTPGPDAGEARGEVLVLDGDGRVLAEFRGIALRRPGHPRRAGQPASPGRPGTSALVRALPVRLPLLGVSALDAPLLNPTRPLLSRFAALIRPSTAAWGLRPDEHPAHGSAPRRAERRTAPPASTGKTPRTAAHAEPPHAEPPHPNPADMVIAAASEVLGVARADLDPRRSLRDLGLDSLMAVQLRELLKTGCGVEITAGRLLGGESLERIVRDLTTAVAAPVRSGAAGRLEPAGQE